MALARAVRTVHAEPPDQVIWREVGSIDGHQVLFQNVLVALYIRNEGKTESGLIIPDKVFEEDRYQAKAAMVLKLGPTAFVDTEDGPKFGGFTVKPGDWVVFRPSEGLAMQIGQCKCRLIADVHIKMVIDHPDDIY
jgi:co-chaperonin GroES (HSP10)